MVQKNGCNNTQLPTLFFDFCFIEAGLYILFLQSLIHFLVKETTDRLAEGIVRHSWELSAVIGGFTSQGANYTLIERQ